MNDVREIDWAETIAYKVTNALRFSRIIDEDNYIVEQEARNEITPIIRRWCIPMERIEDWKSRAEAAEAERDALRAQLAAQEWRSVDEPPTESGDYLVWVKHEGVPGFFSVAQWMKRTLWENNFVHPTYWRLLPPPPPYSKRYGAPHGDAS